jgi:hypothetical protein
MSVRALESVLRVFTFFAELSDPYLGVPHSEYCTLVGILGCSIVSVLRAQGIDLGKWFLLRLFRVLTAF